jgi:hypothetical protein
MMTPTTELVTCDVGRRGKPPLRRRGTWSGPGHGRGIRRGRGPGRRPITRKPEAPWQLQLRQRLEALWD